MFGVHPQHGTLWIDYCGVLMISGSRVLGVEADRIAFEWTAARRDKPGQEWGPTIWEFKPKVG